MLKSYIRNIFYNTWEKAYLNPTIKSIDIGKFTGDRKGKYMDVLSKFLQAEINSKEYYESIMNFINLYEIRKREFEGNEYVIMKMDRDNFIIFPEYDDGEEGIQIPFSLSIYKNRLLDAINSYAQEKGII